MLPAFSGEHYWRPLGRGNTAALQIMLAETACDLQILACHLKKEGCQASGRRSDGQQSLPRKMAKSRPNIWKFALKCMREQKWCQTELRKWAIFRSLGKTYYNLHSTRRKCPPISGGFEANLGMETSSCIRYLQKSFFENVLPTEGGKHIFIKNAKKYRKKMPTSMKNQTFWSKLRR